MRPKPHPCLFVCLALAGIILSQSSRASAQAPSSLSPGSFPITRLQKTYGRLPLSFEANWGQTDEQVKFLSRGPGYTLFLARGGEAVLALRKLSPTHDPQHPLDSARKARLQTRRVVSPAVLRMKLVGANKTPRVESAEELPGKANYFMGNDPKNWRTNIPTYARAKFESVYPGIDLVYYGN
ncbi:MAG TPA: hypothetical protein VFW15_13285, partial [Thermoanaerobaculia bacterium]|nr:hypothetical protein [Thermoanaerobaculia bacterium]